MNAMKGMRIKIEEHNTIKELEKEIKISLPNRYRLRVQAILMAKRGVYPKEILKTLLISNYAFYNWIHKYNKDGLEGLKEHKQGRAEGNPKYEAKIFKELYEELDKMREWWSIKKMQEYVFKLHKIWVPKETMRMRVKRAGYSYKSNRTSPYKGDKQKQDEFKKMALKM